VLWFWAPWCTVCRAEAPDVSAVAADLGDQVNLIGVGGQGGNAEMIEFVEQTGTSAITHVSDPNGVVWSEYEIFAQPAFAFVTADGRVETYVGSLGAEGLTDIIGKLLEA
jgi:thiol-disulfide isomerase/thioredoxin